MDCGRICLPLAKSDIMRVNCTAKLTPSDERSSSSSSPASVLRCSTISCAAITTSFALHLRAITVNSSSVPSWALGRREGRRLRASCKKAVYMCETTMISRRTRPSKLPSFCTDSSMSLGSGRGDASCNWPDIMGIESSSHATLFLHLPRRLLPQLTRDR